MSKLGKLESVLQDLTKQQTLILEYYILFINTGANNACQSCDKSLEYLSDPEIKWNSKKIKPNFGESDTKIEFSMLISTYRRIFFHKLLDNNGLSFRLSGKRDYINALVNSKLREEIAKFIYLEQLFNMSWNDFVSQSKKEFEEGCDFSSFFNITVRAYRHCAKVLNLNETL